MGNEMLKDEVCCERRYIYEEGGRGREKRERERKGRLTGYFIMMGGKFMRNIVCFEDIGGGGEKRNRDLRRLRRINGWNDVAGEAREREE